MRNAIITISFGLMLMTVTSGCASWTSNKPKDKNSMWSRMQFWKKPYQKPQKMAAIWTHDILTMTAKPPTRGFGGRIYFYNDKSQAIPVDGELIVHGYEETSTPRADLEKTKADKTFMFTAEQFTEHFSSSELGASYSVWIPWDAADGMQKQITLIPTFKGTDGSLVQGEPAKLILPGRTVEEPTRSTPFQQVSYEQSEMPTADGPLPVLGGMKTTTITRASKINLASKKSTQKPNVESHASVQPNLGYTTEVRYGNTPLTSNGAQPTSRALSLYPEQEQALMYNQNPGLQGTLTPMGPPPSSTGVTSTTTYSGTMPNSGNVQYTTYPNVQQTMSPMSPASPGVAPGMMPAMLPRNQQNVQPAYVAPTVPNQLNVPPTTPIQTPPGFAALPAVQPQAVQSAFATQWQPFGQQPIPLIQQPQHSQVQPAGYSQSAPMGSANGVTNGVTVGQVQGQPQVQPGQSSPMLNRY